MDPAFKAELIVKSDSSHVTEDLIGNLDLASIERLVERKQFIQKLPDDIKLALVDKIITNGQNVNALLNKVLNENFKKKMLPATKLALDQKLDLYFPKRSELLKQIALAESEDKPYLDLTQIKATRLDELTTAEMMEKYARLETKSLYLNVAALSFQNDELANFVNQLEQEIGTREIVIFYDTTTAGVDQAAFKQYLQDHHISVNIILAPQEQEEQLRSHPLAISGVVYTHGQGVFKYANDTEIILLNSQEINDIILQNHIAKTTAAMAKFAPAFEYRSELSDEYRQGKDASPNLQQKGGGASPQLDVDQDVENEVEIEVEVEVEVEVEKEVEKRQETTCEEGEESLCDKATATSMLTSYLQRAFHTDFIAANAGLHSNDPTTLKNLSTESSWTGGYKPALDYNKIMDMIFEDDVSKISIKAIHKIVENIELFANGINLENLPEGFAFDTANKIIFYDSHLERQSKANDFTIRESAMRADITTPFDYSCLPMASRRLEELSAEHDAGIKWGKFTENDRCDSPLVQLYENHSGHSFTVVLAAKNNSQNFAKPQFTLSAVFGGQEPRSIAHYIQIFAEQSGKNRNYVNSLFKQAGLVQSYQSTENKRVINILNSIALQAGTASITQFVTILEKLNKRKILTEFFNIAATGTIQDYGFLLEPAGLTFFDRLFDSILPLGLDGQVKDPQKLKFIKTSVHKIQTLNHRGLGSEKNLQDLFYSLDAVYENFNHFLDVQ
jgi:hypothetical protein